MFRRLFWLGAGAFLGLWGRHKAVKAAERYLPRTVADRTADSLKAFLGDVSKAQQEAKQAMTQREQQLRRSTEDHRLEDRVD